MCARYGSTLNYSSAAFVPLTLRSAESDIQPFADLRGCIQIVRQRMKRALSYDAAGRSSGLAGMQRAERKVEYETPIWTKKCLRFCLRRLSVGRTLRNEMVAQRRRGFTGLLHRLRRCSRSLAVAASVGFSAGVAGSNVPFLLCCKP